MMLHTLLQSLNTVVPGINKKPRIFMAEGEEFKNRNKKGKNMALGYRRKTKRKIRS